jgi:uncharacterized protein YpmB
MIEGIESLIENIEKRKKSDNCFDYYLNDKRIFSIVELKRKRPHKFTVWISIDKKSVKENHIVNGLTTGRVGYKKEGKELFKPIAFRIKNENDIDEIKPYLFLAYDINK